MTLTEHYKVSHFKLRAQTTLSPQRGIFEEPEVRFWPVLPEREGRRDRDSLGCLVKEYALCASRYGSRIETTFPEGLEVTFPLEKLWGIDLGDSVIDATP